MSAELVLPTNLPSFIIRDSYGPRAFTMPVSSTPQTLDRETFATQMENIRRVYLLFEQIWEEVTNTRSRSLKNLPLDIQKAETLWKECQKPRTAIPRPRSAVVRIDTVNGKIVDINNKAAGLGLTCAAYLNWDFAAVWETDSQPLQPAYQALIPEAYKEAVVLTERRYSFVADQMKVAEIAQVMTNRQWKIMYPDETLPPLVDGQVIFSFSYLNSFAISQAWRKLLLTYPNAFLVNPLSAVYWDNKAFMALPFLDLGKTPYRAALDKVDQVFPRTYLLKMDPKREKLLLATKLTAQGLEFQSLERGNVPLVSEAYLKPLGLSGGKDVVVKKLGDWGGALKCFERYGRMHPKGFIVQEKVAPLQEGMFYIKDGYFVSTVSGTAEFVALERMGITEENDKIHGGSKTSLIPVALSKAKLLNL